MSYPDEKDALEVLFNSRGAQTYWDNWNTLRSWYGNSMLPEILKSQRRMDEECRRGIKRKRKQKKRRKVKKKEETTEEDNVRSASVDVDGDVDRTADMSSEFLEFYQKTLQHRKELKKLRDEQGVQDEVMYAADDEGPEEKPTPSSAAPDLQAGTARTKELESLYGSASAKIQILETQLQARFDENRTRFQPKFWPVIPLHL